MYKKEIMDILMNFLPKEGISKTRDKLSSLIAKAREEAYKEGLDAGIKTYEDLARYIQTFKKKFITSTESEE